MHHARRIPFIGPGVKLVLAGSLAFTTRPDSHSFQVTL